MSKITLSSNLEQLMRIHGNLSVSDLARTIHLPQPTLHHILSGSTKKPRKNALEALANFFNISIQQLVGEEPLPNIIPDTIKENLKLRTVPIIPWEILKSWPQVNINNLHLKEILLDRDISDNSFALVMQDASMEPLFPQNTVLIFDFSKKPIDRDFVIAALCRDNTILFNRLFNDNNENYIKKNLEDGDAKLIKLDSNVDRIIGTLIEMRVQY